MLFTTKYCPDTLDDFIGNQNAKNLVSNILVDYNMPNLIIVGSHGIGKSTLCTLLLKSYFGPDYENFVLKIYGSIERGKDTISDYVDKKKKTDCIEIQKFSLFISKKLNLPTNKCRIVVIYDFYNMTSSAQQTLKAIIEEKSSRVRFIFICNDLNSVSEALQSRATPILMSKIDHATITKKLKEISSLECKYHLSIPDEIYDIINLLSDGDLKSALNYLQIYLHSIDEDYSSFDDVTKLATFYKIFDIPHLSIIKKIIVSRNYTEIWGYLRSLIDNGFNQIDILDILLIVLKSLPMTECRIKHLSCISKTYKNYMSDPDIVHLFALFNEFVQNNIQYSNL